MNQSKPVSEANVPSIRVGVSSCLLGQEVRYDGGHSRDRYVADTLAEHFALVPVCPEAELGMGTPRETVRLHGDDLARPRMIGSLSATDWTSGMNRFAATRIQQLGSENLCGYVFKKNSPSCGVFRVKVYRDKGMPQRKGRGLFASAFAQRYPLVPLEEEGRLQDSGLRENFVERVFALHRLQQVFTGRWKRSELMTFHANEKYLLMAHDPQGLKYLGQLVGQVKQHTPAQFRDQYMVAFMAIMARTATVPKHVNALQHVAGHLRGLVSSPAREKILAVIAEFKQGYVPLIVPMTLIQHYIELHDVPYVNRQTYLTPHPRELKLRNHA